MNNPIQWTAFPEPYCFAGYRQLATDILKTGYLVQPDWQGKVHVSASPPDVDDRLTTLWIKLDDDSLRNPIGRFIWSNTYGKWVWPFQGPPPGSTIIAPASIATAADLDNYDGGSPGAVTATTGPFWEIDPDFAAQVPIGAGTLPSGAVLAVGAQGGAENITLDGTNLPEHRHAIGIEANGEGGASAAGTLHVTGTTSWDPGEATSQVMYTRNAGTTTPIEFTNLPPYRVRNFIRRTARAYRTG